MTDQKQIQLSGRRRTLLTTVAAGFTLVAAIVVTLKAPPNQELVTNVDPVQEELSMREQIDLLSHKVVVLSARQADEKALKQELEGLKYQIEQIQQALDAQNSQYH